MRSEPRFRVLLAALGLAGILGAAPAASAATLTFSTPISGDPALVTLELLVGDDHELVLGATS